MTYYRMSRFSTATRATARTLCDHEHCQRPLRDHKEVPSQDPRDREPLYQCPPGKGRWNDEADDLANDIVFHDTAFRDALEASDDGEMARALADALRRGKAS